MADSNLKSEGPLIQTLRLKGGPGRPGLENDISWPCGLQFGPKIKWQPGSPEPLATQDPPLQCSQFTWEGK